MNKAKHVVGLDVGGTNVVGAVVTGADARLLARASIPTDAARGPDDGLRRIGDLVERLIATTGLAYSEIGGIGIGATGPVDTPTGRIHNPYTLPTWEDVPIGGYLAGRFQLPTLLIGDCDAAALGEFWAGAGQGSRHMLYMTFGTGIGGGIIIDGKLHRGIDLASSEPGHMVIDWQGPPCYCGAQGCFEMLASGPAIARFARERAEVDSLLLKLVECHRELITAETVSQAAEQGDPIARELIRQTATYIGIGLANLINILTPEVVVLGGGVMQGWPVFAPVTLATIQARGKMVPIDQIAIRTASLKLNAGVTGAARALLDHLAGKLTNAHAG